MTMMRDLTKQNVCVVGLGVTGQSVLRFLSGKVKHLVALDEKLEAVAQPIQGVSYHLGSIDESLIVNADLMVLSPGIPLTSDLVKLAKKHEVEVIGDITLYQWFNQAKTIAITGSNGKSTVTELTTAILNASSVKAMAGGNIGYPVLDLLDQDADVHVLELSSFQLDLCADFQSDVATVINITHDHMDRYTSFEEYSLSKLSLLAKATHIVVNLDAPETHRHDLSSPSTTVTLGLTDKDFGYDQSTQSITFNGQDFIHFPDCQLKGEHNVINIQIASALALAAGAQIPSIKNAVLAFQGLAHRCQTVGIFDDVTWINDSKATNVAAAIAAVEGLSASINGKLYWLAGGVGKGADFSPLTVLAKSKIAKSFLFGRDAEQLAKYAPNSVITDSMNAAIYAAKAEAQSGDVVLLAPACASFDSFKNYQDRGNKFCQTVQELYCDRH